MGEPEHTSHRMTTDVDTGIGKTEFAAGLIMELGARLEADPVGAGGRL